MDWVYYNHCVCVVDQIMMALSYEKLVEPPVVRHADDSEGEG